MKTLKPLLKPYKKLFKETINNKRYQDLKIQKIISAEVCDCVGSSGEIKDWYRDKSIAMWVAKRYQREFGVQLDIYKCDKSNGWHLTKQYL